MVSATETKDLEQVLEETKPALNPAPVMLGNRAVEIRTAAILPGLIVISLLSKHIDVLAPMIKRTLEAVMGSKGDEDLLDIALSVIRDLGVLFDADGIADFCQALALLSGQDQGFIENEVPFRSLGTLVIEIARVNDLGALFKAAVERRPGLKA